MSDKVIYKDFMGQELAIGDTIAFIPNHYRELTRGKIVKLNPKKATIEYNCRFGTGVDKTYREYSAIVKQRFNSEELTEAMNVIEQLGMYAYAIAETYELNPKTRKNSFVSSDAHILATSFLEKYKKTTNND